MGTHLHNPLIICVFASGCGQGTYGNACAQNCSTRHCEGNSTCGIVDGKCEHGCQAGWQGVDCKGIKVLRHTRALSGM